ncbi:hypothetical protein ACFQDG_11520 [Natronoarchaeum mannanilyticum]|uniref:Uncharacterized protein n=1 Tax=Natronoarchaeum mannanilyticum TaxID=926360 RepID=A0AAV3TAJ1_9EURY
MPEDQAGANRILQFPAGRFENSIVTGVLVAQGLIGFMGSLMVLFWVLAVQTHGYAIHHIPLVGAALILLAYFMKYLYTVDEDNE